MDAMQSTNKPRSDECLEEMTQAIYNRMGGKNASYSAAKALASELYGIAYKYEVLRADTILENERIRKKGCIDAMEAAHLKEENERFRELLKPCEHPIKDNIMRAIDESAYICRDCLQVFRNA